jgi:hypothetical protein
MLTYYYPTKEGKMTKAILEQWSDGEITDAQVLAHLLESQTTSLKDITDTVDNIIDVVSFMTRKENEKHWYILYASGDVPVMCPRKSGRLGHVSLLLTPQEADVINACFKKEWYFRSKMKEHIDKIDEGK